MTPRPGDYLPNDVWVVGGRLDGVMLKIFTMRAARDRGGFRGYWLHGDTLEPDEPAVVTSGMLPGQECPEGYVVVWRGDGPWVAIPLASYNREGEGA